jgi:uncharacterized protein (DUF697 family)/predicted nuclease with TOPRIM domain
MPEMKKTGLKEEVERRANSLKTLVDSFIEDPSIPEQKKIQLIIHATGIVCALVAVQPIPFADIFILTPIQMVMVMGLSRVMGNPIGRHGANEIFAYLTGVVGWGVLAQQLILAAYKSFLPYLGGLTTIPLVYGATVGLGYAAKAVIEARQRDQTVTKEEIKRIESEARKRAQAEAKNFSIGNLKKELEDLRRKASEYDAFKQKLNELYRQIAVLTNDIVQKEQQLEKQMQKEETIQQECSLLRKKIEELKGQSNKLENDLRTVLEENEDLKQRYNVLKEEFQRLYTELEAKEIELEEERKRRIEIAEEKERLIAKQQKAKKKQKEILQSRYQKLYPDIEIRDKALDFLINLPHEKEYLFEKKISSLQHDRTKIRFKDKIHGTDCYEIEFGDDGRIYVQLRGNKCIVHLVGNKATQLQDIEYLRRVS